MLINNSFGVNNQYPYYDIFCVLLKNRAAKQLNIFTFSEPCWLWYLKYAHECVSVKLQSIPTGVDGDMGS